MGKKIIICGADFSANGMPSKTYKTVGNKNLDAIEEDSSVAFGAFTWIYPNVVGVGGNLVMINFKAGTIPEGVFKVKLFDADGNYVSSHSLDASLAKKVGDYYSIECNIPISSNNRIGYYYYKGGVTVYFKDEGLMYYANGDVESTPNIEYAVTHCLNFVIEIG